MGWKIIEASKIAEWNEKLKFTTAIYNQFPYYVIGEYHSTLTKPVFINYIENEEVVAYAAIIEINFIFFKTGIIEGGPVVLKDIADKEKLMAELKEFIKRKNYAHLQIRPEINSVLIPFIHHDPDFVKGIFFPFHQKEDKNLNIYNKPEKELLASFKMQCRRKIVLSERLPFVYKKVEDEESLAQVKKLFDEVADKKNFGFKPFHILQSIYENGKARNLCDIYCAYLNGDLVNAVFIVKDAQSYYHYTSALVVKDYHPNLSPPSKLHFLIMKECFYEDHKSFYNISFGGSDNLVRFKELFNPVEVQRPDYYTYIHDKKIIKILSKFSPAIAKALRFIFK